MSGALRKARTLTTFSCVEITLMGPVFVLLGLARLAILMLPFRFYAGRLGAQSKLTTTHMVLEDVASLKRAKGIGRVVRSMAQLTPWASLCLAQAMVAAFLLRLFMLPYCVVFGVAPAADKQRDNPLDAHAWVTVGDMVVTGGQGIARFTVVKVFEHNAKRTN